MLGNKDEEKKIELWLERKVHHRNASVVYITQNLFQPKTSRTISLNAHYLILFQSPRDEKVLNVLAQQLQSPHVTYAFNIATSKLHGYLLVDTPDHLRFRTEIFQHWFTKSEREGPVVYYQSV